MIYGYLRVSTAKQNIDRQERNILAAYPEADTSYRDFYTGTKTNRPALKNLLKRLKSGDILVCDSVSRLSRNSEEGWNIYKDLFDRGVELIFLNEPHINTSTYKTALANVVPMTGGAVDAILRGVNEYLMLLAQTQIRLAFEQAEKEVSDLHKRTSQGIETARLAGKQIGAVPGKKLVTKKSVRAKEQIRRLAKDFGGSLNDKECMKLLGITRNTYYKYKKEMKTEDD